MSNSFIYVIGPKNTNIVKIGFSRSPIKRLKSLQTGHPNPLTLYYQKEIKADKAKLFEGLIHKTIKHLRINGEWFLLTPEEATMEVDFAFIRYENEHLI